jgi:hypothetical protein
MLAIRKLNGLVLWCAVVMVAVATSRASAAGGSITVELPAGAKVVSAVATAGGVNLDTRGTVDNRAVHFTNLLLNVPYDVRIDLADGTVMQGVNLDWYDTEPARKNAEPMDDDDLAEIKKILAVPAFANQQDILMMNGTHDRAALLIRFLRTSDFHSDTGGEVIWRVEIWYFKNEHGGWAALNDVNKVLRRERYPSPKEYLAATSKVQWLQTLGGITLTKTAADKTVDLAHPPSTAPATQPSVGP